MADDDAKVQVYVARFPLGDLCKKKNGILAKKPTEEEARNMVSWHLQQSPYHNMTEDEAEEMAKGVDVESWEEEAWDKDKSWDKSWDADGDNWQQRRKKPRRGGGYGGGQQQPSQMAVEAAAFRMLAKSGIASVPEQQQQQQQQQLIVAPFKPCPQKRPLAENVVLSLTQLKTCVDSIKRAKAAAESACVLCSKASRAFGEEAQCLQSCQDMLESLMQ